MVTYEAYRAPAYDAPVVEPAPGRRRINRLAIVMMALFALLAGRALQLSFMGAPAAAFPASSPAAPVVVRADLVDRHGVLLATMLPSWTLAGEPQKVWDPAQAARRLATAVPGLDVATTERRLRSDARLVHLKPGLTASQKRAVHDLGIAGVTFEKEQRRVYPNGVLAGHLMGSVNRAGEGAGGVEGALDKHIRAAGAAGRTVALSIDTRIQYALESELADAAWAAKAKGGAAILLDGRTGETLALASWPQVDPNAPGTANETAQLNRVTGADYEMGSTIKPFTAAMALDLGRLTFAERFDLTAAYTVDAKTIRDPHPYAGPATIREAIAHSSNVALAQVALRVGEERQRAYLARLGLFSKPTLEIAGAPAPLLPPDRTRTTTAVMGYGHAFGPTLAAVAGAYTVFVNDGARVTPTLLRRAPGDPAPRTAVFSAAASRATVQLMREVVVEGTARSADLRGLDIAGKTGTAEKNIDGRYNPDRMFSSFAAIFPARAPRYVVVLGLDEPQRTPENGNLATGGAVAAPAVGRFVARIAPFLAHAPAQPEGLRTGGGTP
jgi:cell division protein FtsI (penicillin-binding protein 3)